MLRILSDETPDQEPSVTLLTQARESLGAEFIMLAVKRAHAKEWHSVVFPESSSNTPLADRIVNDAGTRLQTSNFTTEDITIEVQARHVASRAAPLAGSGHVGLVLAVFASGRPSSYVDPLDRIILEALARAAVRVSGLRSGVHPVRSVAQLRAEIAGVE
jgi:hypothetical protein